MTRGQLDRRIRELPVQPVARLQRPVAEAGLIEEIAAVHVDRRLQQLNTTRHIVGRRARAQGVRLVQTSLEVRNVVRHVVSGLEPISALVERDPLRSAERAPQMMHGHMEAAAQLSG